MKVASYNIHKCKGLDGALRPDRIIAVLGEIDADLIALQEVDRRFGTRRGLLDPNAILRATGMHLLLQSDAPHGHGWHGNALLVRGEPKFYLRERVALPGLEPRGAIFAELDLGEGKFRVIAAHLGLLRQSRLEQADALLAAFLELPRLPTILLGDFNEWRRHRRSSLGVLEPMFGVAPAVLSFPSMRPMFPLDRILGWPARLVSGLKVHDSPLARQASDHLPLIARVSLAEAAAEVPDAA
jgi:endonuclease/exonuclease/phosphatase family metal-dependent hydrolase